MATKREEAIAILAARYGAYGYYEPYRDGSAMGQAAARAIEEVTWAERIGRLDQLHVNLTAVVTP